MNNIALMMWSKIPKVVSYQLPPTISQVKKATKIAFKNTLYFTACSNFIARQINKFANVTTIYNGVNINEYQFNATVSADAPLVFLGRIQEEKGTSIAIQVARTTGRKLIIAGNIPAEETHKQYFSTKVKPFIDDVQISYIGPVNNFQKNELLGNSYALLMPVTWDEPFGIVMAEALACGTPVIGFNRGAIPEVVINGLNGFVCNTLTEMIAAVGHIPEVSRLTFLRRSFQLGAICIGHLYGHFNRPPFRYLKDFCGALVKGQVAICGRPQPHPPPDLKTGFQPSANHPHFSRPKRFGHSAGFLSGRLRQWDHHPFHRPAPDVVQLDTHLFYPLKRPRKLCAAQFVCLIIYILHITFINLIRILQ